MKNRQDIRQGSEVHEVPGALSPPELNRDVVQLLAFLAETVQPEKIFLLNHPALPEAREPYLDLLVVVPSRSHILFAEHQGLVEFANLRNHQVICSLHRSDAVREALEQGHIYYTLSCTPQNLVYDNGSGLLPPAPVHLYKQLVEHARNVFEASYSRAQAFYDCALYCRGKENASIVPFLLHQAAELTCRAVLLSLMDKEMHTHSVKALIRHSRRCTPQLNAVFPRDTREEKQLVHQLEEAYLKGRYNSDYTMEDYVLQVLFERVGKLLLLAKQVFEERIRVFEQDTDSV